jgi:hypothetical protein
MYATQLDKSVDHTSAYFPWRTLGPLNPAMSLLYRSSKQPYVHGHRKASVDSRCCASVYRFAHVAVRVKLYIRKKRAIGFRIHSSALNLKLSVEIGNNYPAAVLCCVTRHGVSKFLRTALFSTPVITFVQSIERNLCKQNWGFQSRSEICPTLDWSELRILIVLVQHHHPQRSLILCGNAETLAGLVLEREREREELISRHSAPHFRLVKTR